MTPSGGNKASDLEIEMLSINTLRTLAMDAVEAANSGHPGTPMSLSPVAYCLWQEFLRYNPKNPLWPNRDRFVLSVGHASMLLYGLLHCTGVHDVDDSGRVLDSPAVSIAAIKSFRQLESRCPGHPEYRHTAGVETTTGPLGQGLATSVGMAMAAQWLAEYFNRPKFDLFDYDVYALCGDGCLMEGISGEAASLAGHLKLSNLCWIYDSNQITIEGRTDITFSEDVGARFRALGWQVAHVADANDLSALRESIAEFKRTKSAPTLIIVESKIAFGSPNKEDTSAAHGAPLGGEEVRLTKQNYGWPEAAHFLVPEAVKKHFASGIGERGAAQEEAWNTLFETYQKTHPALAETLNCLQNRNLPTDWDADLPTYPATPKGPAGRASSSEVLNAIAGRLPWLIGGSADLTPSTKTKIACDSSGVMSAENPGARNIAFGVREHAMAAIVNGLCLTNLRPFAAGFFVFSDYARASIRMAALMEVPVIHIFTHDSIGVGEDGPTHQPIEHLASLRAMPGLLVIRPADANEVVAAWRVIMNTRDKPVALLLSRQATPTFDREKFAVANIEAGAYVLADCEGVPDVILIGTGTEVALCLEASEQLSTDGIRVRVVSMPSFELFESQPADYKESVLPRSVGARVSVEAGSTFGWDRYIGPLGLAIGMREFGASAPLRDLQQHFGFTAEDITAAARETIAHTASQNG